MFGCNMVFKLTEQLYSNGILTANMKLCISDFYQFFFSNLDRDQFVLNWDKSNF